MSSRWAYDLKDKEYLIYKLQEDISENRFPYVEVFNGSSLVDGSYIILNSSEVGGVLLVRISYRETGREDVLALSPEQIAKIHASQLGYKIYRDDVITFHRHERESFTKEVEEFMDMNNTKDVETYVVLQDTYNAPLLVTHDKDKAMKEANKKDSSPRVVDVWKNDKLQERIRV